ncbi:MAG TPA: RidA family protein [Rubrivivax sp.]|nr:RidA family protein [Burkholderiales bacterium]HNU10820.1 RidA family protein [Rubrivivax sp.]
MTIDCLQPVNLARPGGHYSPVVVAGGQVWVSGQLPIDRDGRKLSNAPFAEQARQVLANLDAALVGARSNRLRLVQVRVYLADIAHWAEFDALYAQWLGAHRPARAVVPVPALHHGFLIEVEATALLDEPAPGGA